ncbi:MAG: baseplate J/gp47 family protein [Oscillospiraceae bacterium]|jgi:uncharacterized phage protein gp47/JayE|nr:baseplate J/gp47 family protein [Oscillospiraceae bacterium]
MFEDKTFEALRTLALQNAPANIDTRQGEIFYDAVVPLCAVLARTYVDLSLLMDGLSPDTAMGDDLDRVAASYGLVRNAATSARYVLVFTGSVPPIGTRFSGDEQYFALEQDGTDLCLRAETAGTAANGIAADTAAVPVYFLDGLSSARFGGQLAYGEDAESDDDLRTRLRELLRIRVDGANREQYIAWCERVDGVGAVRILPRWNGANTVGAVLIAPDGTPASTSVVSAVQRAVDPDLDGDGVGDGLGAGLAPIGAQVTAMAAEDLPVLIDAAVVLSDGATLTGAQTSLERVISAYLAELALHSPTEAATLLYSQIGAKLAAIPDITDYSDLTINGGAGNIALTLQQVPVLQEVSLHV